MSLSKSISERQDSSSLLISNSKPLVASSELELALTNAAQYRLSRVCQQLEKEQLDAILLWDPINIKYATESSNMQVWTLHNAERYAMVFADGYVVLWDFHGCEHLTEGNQQIDEVRSSVSWSHFGAGQRAQQRMQLWADEISDLLSERVGSGARIAADLSSASAAAAFSQKRVDVCDGEALMGEAKLIKSDDEIKLMQFTIEVAERGIQRMYQELQPGKTENEIWAYLHFENIKCGGEWIETRLLSSGSRTNPWMQESSNRVLQEGELLCFDTDLIGPFGYCADISRAWTVGHTKPSKQQKSLYTAAFEQVHYNQDLLRPGLSYKEFSDQAWKIPANFYKNRYCCIAHGVGMADENPAIAHAGDDWRKAGYDGVFQENMVVCVESYIGEEGGLQGVKLEQQVLITEQGCRPLSSFPFETDWLL